MSNKQDIIKAYCGSIENKAVACRTLARRIFDENEGVWSTEDACYQAVRRVRGKQGPRKRKNNRAHRSGNYEKLDPKAVPIEGQRVPDRDDWDVKQTTAEWAYDGDVNLIAKGKKCATDIERLDQALEFCQVDLKTWEVERHVFNKWPTTAVVKGKDGGKFIQKANVQIKIWFRKKIDHDIDWDAELKRVHSYSPGKRKIRNVKGKGEGIVGMADFHFGAYIDDLIRSKKFNIGVLVEYMDEIAAQVNAKKMEKVHLFWLGDFIESFSGLNHRNSWKGLAKGQFGVNATVLCFELLMEHLVKKIRNLSTISMVSGNHDRTSADRELDPKGEVAQLLAYMFQRELRGSGVDVHYHPMVLTREIEGICYVLTHGHHGFSKRELAQTLFDYGKQGMYNVLCMGHTHSRKVTKQTRNKAITIDSVDVVGNDNVDSRTIVFPSLFTGNFYSESLGFTSSAGYNWMESNGRGAIRFIDEVL